MEIITGKPNYVKLKMQEFVMRGYIVISSNHWSDGTVTVKLKRLM